MKNYIYIDDSRYMEQSINNYEKFTRLMNNFQDYSKVTEVSFNLADIIIEPRLTRIVLDNTCYVVEKHFVMLYRDEQFFILRPAP
jgi:hypothetical protein